MRPTQASTGRAAWPLAVPRLFTIGLIELLAGCAHAQTPARKVEWRLVADIPLPGRPGRFDYQSLDPTTGQLWIAHMGAGEVLAFDVRRREVVARVPNMPGATGVLAVPALRRVFVSVSGHHEVAVINAANGQVLARLR